MGNNNDRKEQQQQRRKQTIREQKRSLTRSVKKMIRKIRRYQDKRLSSFTPLSAPEQPKQAVQQLWELKQEQEQQQEPRDEDNEDVEERDFRDHSGFSSRGESDDSQFPLPASPKAAAGAQHRMC